MFTFANKNSFSGALKILKESFTSTVSASSCLFLIILLRSSLITGYSKSLAGSPSNAN